MSSRRRCASSAVPRRDGGDQFGAHVRALACEQFEDREPAESATTFSGASSAEALVP